jgi:hypothetical protein
MAGGYLNLADSGGFAIKGNSENPPIEDELVRFFWPGCIKHRGGALGVLRDASGGLHRWRGSTTGARVSVLGENSR